jgi:hypothetical protein
MINLGDKVRFLNENLEGIVTSIKSKNQIGVTVDSDFEIPVLVSEVVKVKFDEKSGNNDNSSVLKPLRAANSFPLGIFLAYERIGETELSIHIHNNYSEFLNLLVYQKDQGVFHLKNDLKLDRDETKIIGRARMDHFDKWPAYHFVLMPFETTTVKPFGSLSTNLSFQSKTFHNYFKHCFFLDKQAYVFKLDEPLEKLNLQALKDKDFNEKFVLAPIDLKKQPSQIIDLHYDALKSNGYGTAEDITAFQMDIFNQVLEAAFVHHMKEIIFIHGVGNAYLKNKIRTYLSKHPEVVLNFEDADILKYGGGATLVRMK